MTEIETLYKLIENVDKDDTAMLDEIDARTDAFYKGIVFEQMAPDWEFVSGGYWTKGTSFALHDRVFPSKYSTSIDAQEQIDTEGWEFYMTQNKGLYIFGGARDSTGTDQIESPELQTEALARLHLLLQVVEYEWGRK